MHRKCSCTAGKRAMPTFKCFLSTSRSLFFQFSRQPICLNFHCEATVLANRLFLLQCASYLLWPQSLSLELTFRKTTYAPVCYFLLFLIFLRLLLIHSVLSCYKFFLFLHDFAMKSWANWCVVEKLIYCVSRLFLTWKTLHSCNF